jgi:hypothetical protein
MIKETGLEDMDWIDLARGGEGAGASECANKPSGSIKCGGYAQLRNYQHCHKESAPVVSFRPPWSGSHEVWLQLTNACPPAKWSMFIVLNFICSLKKIFLPHRKHCGSTTKTFFAVYAVLWNQTSKVWTQWLGYTDNAYGLYSGRPRFKSWSKYQSS